MRPTQIRASRLLKSFPVLTVLLLSTTVTLSRDLTFDERVAAQEAIERVYYSHQIGATKPFEEARPRALLEQKVHTYLSESSALEHYWRTPVTAQALQLELERIIRSSRMPARLDELFQALGRDPLVIKECLVRAALVDRLINGFFKADQRIHGSARAEAEELRMNLLSGELRQAAEHPYRTVVEASPGESAVGAFRPQHPAEDRGTSLAALPVEEGRDWRASATNVGEIGNVLEERDAFIVKVILSERAGRARIATYSVPKVSWDSWWSQNNQNFGEAGVARPEMELNGVPLTAASVSASSDCAPGDSWINGDLGAVPDERGGHAMVWTGSLLLVWGGYRGTYLNSGSRYDPVTDTWSEMSMVNAPSARQAPGVWTGNQMIVWGGYGEQNFRTILFNDGARYDPETDTWAPISNVNAPSARFGHTLVWAGDRAIVWGGVSTNYVNSGGQYDPIGDHWTQTSLTNAPEARSGHTAVWTGKVMIVWGGMVSNSFLRNTGGRYDPRSDTWQEVSTTTAPIPRSMHGAVWTGSAMVVWGGGVFFSAQNTGGRYDPVTDTWVPTAIAPIERISPLMVWTGSEVLIWGGHNLGYWSKTGARYNPLSDTWAPMSEANSLVASVRYQAVWTGSLMLIWGADPGGRYEPQSDSWTPIATTDAPEPGQGSTAVWTGNEMIVWGGEKNDYSHYLNSGGRYDPVLDRWSAVTIANAPTGRVSHSAIWTGESMVVWGGSERRGSGGVPTGGRYDPFHDAWTSTSNSGAPIGCFDHTAVWTGHEMIVWGGRDGTTFEFQKSGGRYNPATDTWLPTSTLNAPQGRIQHLAVWTGTEMVIWGGDGHEHFMATGGRYNPASNTWRPTSTMGAPDGRYLLSGVWTGKLMLIWGGWGAQNPQTLNTGSRYDPENDTWSPMSMVHAPSGRYHHTTVWTGKEMIIWGGGAPPFNLGDGARYDPILDYWNPIAAPNAPDARSGHSAVWTGEFMMIWGSGFSRGGRYAPYPIGIPLMANAGADQRLECGGTNGTPVVLTGVGTQCGEAGPLTFTWAGDFPEGGGTAQGSTVSVTLPLGFHTIVLTVDDGLGHSATDTMSVTVQDTIAPMLTCPSLAPAECSSLEGTPLIISPAQVIDVCDPHPFATNSNSSGGTDASGTYLLGQTEVSMTATDTSGNQSSCSFPVIVRDTTPPQIASALNTTLLWPPNHRAVAVEASVAPTDACSTPAIYLTSVTSSEPDDSPGGGDGNTSGDIQGAEVGTSDFDIQLRAERDAAGGGRAYRVTYTAVDGSGNQASASSIVFVPHDQGGSSEPVLTSANSDERGTVLTWNPVPGDATYRVVRGNVASLSDAGAFIDLGAVTCLRSASGATSTNGNEDADIPALGEAFFYVVAYNDGNDSGYGSATAAKPRVVTAGECE